ncbi:C10 family peptidase [Dyadobacter aurulentus]|uniref:C10 family peptidase n=1 Tax=Dyadobacter sp. UC 10 TaxID=2605428 RepID=UPI0011F1058E|nr:C10 family peptidase [Dyadobacter sp. UC 10]KAA0992902.1 hypothetical protein FXO21_23380 [Dyadobacter sp. UC 10]
MMHTCKPLRLLLGIVFSVLACSRDENPKADRGGLEKFANDKFIVSRDEALSMVEYAHRNARTLDDKKKNKRVKKIEDFVGPQGKTIFYSITYENNEGFLLMSADRRMKPLLAYSDQGAFDLNTDNPGIQLWKDFIVENAKVAANLDTAHINVVNEWRLFERGEGANLRTAEQPVWTPEASCDYFVNHPIPANVTVQHLTHDVAFWGQGSGYNAHCPDGINTPNCNGSFDCSNAPVGCGPVAIGQVLRYYARTVNIGGTSYTTQMFNAMPRLHSGTCAPADGTPEGNLSHLLRDIGKSVDATYNTLVPFLGIPMSGSGCQTWSQPGKTDDFFATRGFTAFDLDFFNASNQTTIKNSLLARRPVIVYGSNCSTCLPNMHIWVIDGVQDLHAIYTNQQGYCYEHSSVLYQMNWGWADDPQNNGWFSYTGIVGSGTLYNSSNMKAYIITPN